jgi:hypothetical protein
VADQFRTIVGIVEFPPRDGEAAGKPVRNLAISQTGFKDQAVRVYATLWPSFKHVKVEEGDVVILRGKYNANPKTKEDGTKIVYHNLSVLAIKNLGPMEFGTKPDTENTDDDADGDDEDIPF